MNGELISLTPEALDIANAYIEYGSAYNVSQQLCIPEYQVIQLLERKDVRDYLNGVYLDRGYRNRDKIGKLLDKLIEKKLEEAEESDIYTSKDLYDLIALAHKMRMDEMKASESKAGPTINIANFGGENYSNLMGRLLEHK